MGQAKRQRLAALPPKTQPNPNDGVVAYPMVLNEDGSTSIMLINLDGPPSNIFRYSSRTGKLEEADECPVEWLGSITVSPNFAHRLWFPIKSFCADVSIPTGIPELEKFIQNRGDKGPWYRMKVSKTGQLGVIHLPSILSMAMSMTEVFTEKENAIVSHVAVAPHCQRRGIGRFLHVLMARYLKGLGYKTLSSDIVGLNTKGEVAVWESLQKEVNVESLNMGTSSWPRVLHKMNVINNVMYRNLLKHHAMNLDGELIRLGAIEKTDFPQFEMDLTDERIQIWTPPPMPQESEQEPQQPAA
jgi:hypothetical protein